MNEGIDYCPKCTDDALIYRYYIPLLFEIQLDGREVVHHYLTDGTLIDADFPDQSKHVTQGESLALTPAINDKYDYVGYKKSTEGPPSGGSIASGNPPDVPYDGTYDIYHVNLYYTKKPEASATIRYVDRNGVAIPGLSEFSESLIKNQNYTYKSAPAPAGYTYAGYAKTTTGVEPTPADINNPTPAPAEYPPLEPFLGNFSKLYLYYVYDADLTNGKIHVRHMVRTGPTGTFTKAAETIVPVVPLPGSRKVDADSSYGTILGKSQSTTAYSDTISSGSSATMALTDITPEGYVTFFYEQAASFSADFDVIPSTIAYKGQFTIHPKDWQLNGCTYQGHSWKISRNGSSWESALINGMTTDSVYSYPSEYPWIIGVGTHGVYMKIVTDCGTGSWIGPKPLTVTGPTNNNPPTLKAGFVRPYDTTKTIVQEVVEGTILDLDAFDFEDPDGDTVYFDGFDFANGSSLFMKSIPSNATPYAEGYKNITMSSLGYHVVKGYVHDEWGATGSATVLINVTPRNPIAIPACPAYVIAGRLVDPALFDSSKSYSPAGVALDQARDEWFNLLDKYENNTGSDITVQIGLAVYDINGLKSLEYGTCTVTVKPDKPPVAKLNVPAKAIRYEAATILNESYSPDGDQIVKTEYQYKYDANNNGFDDDKWVKAFGTSKQLIFTPFKVGKYLFYTKVTEDWGLTGETSTTDLTGLVLNVVNLAPSISFSIEGKNEQPDLTAYTTVKPEDVLKWPVYVTGTTKPVYNKNNLWAVRNNQLVSGEGRNFGSAHQYLHRYEEMVYGGYTYKTTLPFAFQDNGYGPNRLSPWRSTTNFNQAQTNPVFDPAQTDYNFYTGSTPPTIRSSKKLIYYDYTRDTYGISKIYAISPDALPEMDWYINGSAIAKKFKNGTNPFTFVIDGAATPSISRVTKYPTGVYFTGAGYETNYFTGPLTYKPIRIVDWEVAGNRIYTTQLFSAKVTFSTPSGTSSTSFGYYDFIIYDASTGALIARYATNSQLQSHFDAVIQKMSAGTGFDQISFLAASGDRVAMIGPVSSSSNIKPREATSVLFEVNPDLTVDYKATWTASPALDTQNLGFLAAGESGYKRLSDIFFDPTGSMYFYEGYQRIGDYYYDMYVTKHNADYTLAWRVPIGNGGPTKATAYSSNFSYPNNFAGMMVNYDGGELYAKKYYDYYAAGAMIPGDGETVYVINLKTGAIKKTLKSENGDNLDMYTYGDGHLEAAPKYYINRDGTVGSGNAATVTADGNRTTRVPTCLSSGNTPDLNLGYNTVYDSSNQAMGRAGIGCSTTYQIYGEYVGDGIYASLSKYYNYYDTTMDGFYLAISKGTPTTTPLAEKSFTNGQFYSDVQLANADMKFNFVMKDKTYDTEWFGMSFRMQSPTDRYAFETDGKNVVLAMYSNGTKTVLDTSSYAFQQDVTYQVQIKTTGDRLQAFVGKVPLFDVKDAMYTKGRIGYFSDKGFVNFGALQYKDLGDTTEWMTDYAIWDPTTKKAEVAYKDILFTDQENDPASDAYQWSISHLPRFIDNQGLSALNGKTFTSPQLVFDKVGDYMVSLQGQDDPNPNYLSPDMAFDEYRKLSDPFVRKITVHRRPIADFSVSLTAGVVKWVDKSHDPDRYESATKYSIEATGLDYLETRGIVEKKFYYITPSGKTVKDKLITPQEKGVYEIGLAVKDEYGAWSDYAVQMLDVDSITTNNTPPVPGFTRSYINTFRGIPVVFDSTAYDAEDGARESMLHEYYLRNVTTGSAETMASSSRTDWTKMFSTLGTFNVRQVVEDSVGATAQYELQVTIHNRLPVVSVTTPDSADQTKPTKFDTARPSFKWTYGDADGDAQTQYQLRIYRYGGVLQADTNTRTGAAVTFTPNADLPEKVYMYVVVRAYDGYDWGDWSAPKYFYIETNRPPIADFDWTPKPVWEGDTFQLINLSSDPDGAPLTSAWTTQTPLGAISTSSSAPSFANAEPGQYQIELVVSDGQLTARVSKSVTVIPLSIEADLYHTDDWREVHDRAGHEITNNPKDFYSGEVLLSIAKTTAGAPVQRVTAKLTATGLDGGDLTAEWTLNEAGALDRFIAELFDSRWASLKSGLPNMLYSIRFTAVYSNGVVKTTDVPFRIIGSIYEVAEVHRRQ